jgi:Flp pilus assembly protein TadG
MAVIFGRVGSCMFLHSRKRDARDGVASLELALVAPVFLLFFASVTDLSMIFHKQLQLSSALTAGAEYGFTAGQSESGSTLTADVINFVQTLTGSTLSSVTATYNNGLVAADDYCVSGAPATYTGPYAAGTPCADGSTSGKFLSISGTFTYAAIFKADKTFFPTSFSQSVVIRLQ